MIKQLLVYGILIACLITPVHAQAGEIKDQTKAVIVHYTLSGDVLTVIDSRIIYGHPPNNLGHNELAVKVLSRGNGSLKEFGVDDPRILYYDGGAKVMDTVNFSIVTPFFPSMASVDVYSVDIYNGTPTNLMARADLTGTVRDFCSSHREDKDCAGIAGSFPPMLLLLGAGLVVVVAGAGWYLMRKRKGPG